MSLSTKILFAIIAIAFMGIGGFIIYNQITNAQKITDMQNSIVAQKQLLDNITRAQSQYASKDDIQAFAKQHDVDLAIIQKDLDALNAQIVAIGNISVISTGQTNSNVPSTNQTPGTNPPAIDPQNPDPYGYLKNTQTLALNEKFSNVDVPFGSVNFSAWRDKPWDINIATRTYSITSVLGQSETGQHYSYSKFAIKSGDKTYDVKIDNAKFLEEYPIAKWRWLNPQFHLTAGGGINVSSKPVSGDANIGVVAGIINYGKTIDKPDINILQVGIGYAPVSQRPELIINPINVNVGTIFNTQYLNNTYVGPSAQILTNGQIVSGINVGLNF